MSSTPITPPSMATFEGPKVLKPGRAAIPPGDATYAMRIGATNALLQSAIDSAEAILADAQKQPVRLVATSNMALTSLTILDGVSFAADDRILLTGQTAPAENGIWLAQVGAWTRPVDANTGARILGSTVRVLEGTLGAGTLWKLDTLGPITINTTPLVWSALVRAGTGLTASGDTIALSAANVAKLDNLSGIQPHAGSSATLSGAGQQRVTYASGTFTANLPTSTTDWPVGTSRPVVKDNASVYGISLTPDASHSINGGTNGVAVTLFGSTVAPTTTDPRPMWLVTRTGNTTWSYS